MTRIREAVSASWSLAQKTLDMEGETLRVNEATVAGMLLHIANGHPVKALALVPGGDRSRFWARVATYLRAIDEHEPMPIPAPAKSGAQIIPFPKTKKGR
jgi:hypothetical protein